MKKNSVPCKKELKQLALGQRRTDARIIANLDYFLIQSHVKYKDLKKCRKKCPKNCDLKMCSEYNRHLNDIDESIHGPV